VLKLNKKRKGKVCLETFERVAKKDQRTKKKEKEKEKSVI